MTVVHEIGVQFRPCSAVAGNRRGTERREVSECMKGKRPKQAQSA